MGDGQTFGLLSLKSDSSCSLAKMRNYSADLEVVSVWNSADRPLNSSYELPPPGDLAVLNRVSRIPPPAPPSKVLFSFSGAWIDL